MASWGISSESAVRAQAKYDKANTVRISLKLNRGTDADILTWLQEKGGSRQGAIKKALRLVIEQEKESR